MRFFKANRESDGGAAMVEYALMVGVIALVSISAVTLVGDRTDETFDDVVEALDTSDRSLVESGESDDDGGPSDEPGPPADDPEDTEPEATEDPEDTEPEATEEPEDTEENEGSNGPVNTGTSSDFTWWNDTKHGGNGEWKASVDYSNDSDRHQHLRLEVTRVDDEGRTATTIVDSFYVPANGSSIFNQWSNDLRDHKGRITGVTEVQVKVVSVTTSDKDWQPYTYEVGGDPATVTPPSIP